MTLPILRDLLKATIQKHQAELRGQSLRSPDYEDGFVKGLETALSLTSARPMSPQPTVAVICGNRAQFEAWARENPGIAGSRLGARRYEHAFPVTTAQRCDGLVVSRVVRTGTWRQLKDLAAIEEQLRMGEVAYQSRRVDGPTA